MSNSLGKILYAGLFCVVLPMLLIAWASTQVITAPVPLTDYGIFFALAGNLLMLTGMTNLWTFGGGLPMNAYPPEKFVTQGAYRLLKHPIYIGFVLACAGVSMACNSATGFYLVTPTVALGCYALVEGYERLYLEQKFGRPQPARGAVGFSQKFIALLPIWVTWLAGYEFLVWFGYDGRYMDTVLPFERLLPVVEWMEIPYFLTYPFALLTPLLIRTGERLTTYLSTAWFLVIGTLLIMLVIPLYATPRTFEPSTWLGELIMWERRMDSPAAAFPSFHVIWAFLSARTIQCQYPGMGWIAWLLGVLIAVSCVLTGAHSLLDVTAGAVFFLVGVSRARITAWWHRWSESMANSWSEKRFGNFRVISHAGYSGAAGAVAAVILAQFSQDYVLWLSIILAALAGGAIWGQLVEGTPAMLRPFGFYGGLLGGMTAMVVIWVATGISPIYWLGVFALATPLAQATGRLRCLVQGCCHGCSTSGPGIHYFNSHTRVAQIPSLAGKRIYNTQGYSIASNVLIALLLFRLQWGGAVASLLAGSYFILTGAFRFIEEARRGEPQTRIILGLRLYQWIALGSVVFGALLTVVPTTMSVHFQANVSYGVVVTALIAGVSWAFGMSMDFPESRRRFARLTG